MITDRLVHSALRGIASYNPETAHNAALALMGMAQRSPHALRIVERAYQPQMQPVTVCGIEFPHRIGAAPGLDKQGRYLPFLQAMGFGFVEVGSVLPAAQYGNAKPRFFLLPEMRAAINRFGFNSPGAVAVAHNLEHSGPNINIPIGISLGMNKQDVGNDTAVFSGYRHTISKTRPHASFISLNVSSPNTEGLRDMQAAEIIGVAAAKVVDMAAEIPVFIKFSPDMPDDELQASAGACLQAGVSGFIATNTTLSREDVAHHRHGSETGGLSGLPLFPRSLHCIKVLRTVDPTVPIIGVGGVSNSQDAQLMFDAGASLVQFYTALFHQGPIALRRISDG